MDILTSILTLHFVLFDDITINYCQLSYERLNHYYKDSNKMDCFKSTDQINLLKLRRVFKIVCRLLPSYVPTSKTLPKSIKTGKPLKIRLARNGNSNYSSRDILTAINRSETHETNNLFYVTDKSQSDHFDGVYSGRHSKRCSTYTS